MNRLSLLFIMVSAGFSAHAQQDSVIGFYDGSRLELIFNLFVLPNHKFVIKQIYGAEDRLVTGTWKDTASGEILLQETRQPEDAFVVYVAGGKEKERTFRLQYFDQNTRTALAFGGPFQAAKLKYIHRPDEYSFSREYSINVPKDSSEVVYLSQALSDIQHEVYAFEPGDTVQYVSLMYNSRSNEPIFEGTALIKDGMLYLSSGNYKEERIGKRQELPLDFDTEWEQIKNYGAVPDTWTAEENGKPLVFRRIHATSKFKAETELNPQQAYFNNKEETEEILIPMAPPFPPKRAER